MATHRIATQLRIDEKTHDMVGQIAKLEKRSKNYVMEHFIKRGVADYIKKTESRKTFKKQLTDLY